MSEGAMSMANSNPQALARVGDMSAEAIGLRLTAARKAAGYAQKEFAEAVDIKVTTYNSQEKRGAPSKDALQHLFRNHGIDMNFIYYGEMRFLPPHLQADLLAALEEIVHDARPSPDHPDSSN